MDTRALGIRLAAAGALAQVAGLAVDVWQHERDPNLAMEEGVLSLDNPGHALLVLGIALVVIGAALAVFGPRLYRRVDGPVPRRLRVARWGAPIALVALVGCGTAVGANSSLGKPHTDVHLDAGVALRQSSLAAVDDATEGVISIDEIEGDHGHGHGDGEVVPNEPLDRVTRDRLAGELVTARATAARYPTVADAEAAGYRMVTPYLPLIGAHYIKFGIMDGTFDIERPEMLLYDGTDPGSRLVGLSYYVVSATEPEGFAGPNDHWHRHLGLCIHRERLVVVGGERTTAEECAQRGGFKADGSAGWMVHAWVEPGWESPQGVFSAENADLR